MVATLPLEGVETYMLLLFESGWSHPETDGHEEQFSNIRKYNYR